MKQTTTHSKDNSKFFTNAKSGLPHYNLKVPESKKTKQWFIDYMDFIVPFTSTQVDRYQENKSAYELYNGQLDGLTDELERFCNPLGEDDMASMEEEVLAYPKLHNKVNVLKGELLKRADNLKVVLLSDLAIKEKNKQLNEEVKKSLEEDVMIEIEKVKAQLQGMKEQEIQQMVEQIRSQESPEDIMNKDFLSDWEIYYSHVLKRAMLFEDIKYKQVQTLEDVILSDRCFVYVGWKHGAPSIEVRNTLQCGFHKSPNESRVHKGDYFWNRKAITPGEAYDSYGELLSKQDIDDLGLNSYHRSHRIDKRHDVLGGNARPVLETLDIDLAQELVNREFSAGYDKTLGTSQTSSNRGVKDALIWETHLEFKAYELVIFLSYPDDMGEIITTLVNSKFDIPKSAAKVKFTNDFGDPSIKYEWEDMGTHYTAEKLWIPFKYEIVRLGEDVYPIYRKVPFQEVDIERPYSSFELSTKGKIFTARNAESVSLFQRAIPLYLQYIYIKHIQNRELAKYQGYIQSIDVDQIPQELGKDINGDIIRDPAALYLLYRKRLGVDFYSGSQSNIDGGLPPATRSPGSNAQIISTAGDIFNLQQLAEMVDMEMGLAMGISPQREAQFSSSSNVADNQQAITQSHHITEPYFYEHSLIWRDALLDYVKKYRMYTERVLMKNKKETFLHYVLPDGMEELLKVTPKHVEPIDISLTISNSGNDQQYSQYMLQLAHSFGQNSGEGMEVVSALLKSITSGSSPEETHKLIAIESNKQRERMQASEQANAQMQERMTKMQLEAREDEQAHEVELANIKGNFDIQGKTIMSFSRVDDQDSDNDGIPDQVEIMKLGLQADIKAAEIEHDTEEKEKDRKLEREKIKSQEKIAKNKPKTSK